jgi:hypothetical protein
MLCVAVTVLRLSISYFLSYCYSRYFGHFPKRKSSPPPLLSTYRLVDVCLSFNPASPSQGTVHTIG